MLRVPLRLTVFCSFLWVLSAFPQSTPKAVIVNWHGVNYPAHITAVENGRYHIRYDEHREGRADEEWVDVKRLKNSDYSPFRADAANLATTPPAKATSGYATAAPASLPTGLLFVHHVHQRNWAGE